MRFTQAIVGFLAASVVVASPISNGPEAADNAAIAKRSLWLCQIGVPCYLSHLIEDSIDLTNELITLFGTSDHSTGTEPADSTLKTAQNLVLTLQSAANGLADEITNTPVPVKVNLIKTTFDIVNQALDQLVKLLPTALAAFDQGTATALGLTNTGFDTVFKALTDADNAALAIYKSL